MDKEDKEIVDRLADIACSYNPQAMDYPNVIVFRKDLIGLVNICDRLEQQLKKKQEIIDKAVNLLNNPWSFESGNKEVDEFTYKKKREVIDILKDVK